MRTISSRRAIALPCALISAIAVALTSIAFSIRARADAPTYDRTVIEARTPSRLRQKPRAGDAYLASGQSLYGRFCAPCHGEQGRGDGPAWDVMRPRPRDFTLGNFAFRSTRSGELPTDADLFLTISRGVPGTSMPAWGEGIFMLSETQRWQLVYYVKYLNGTFWDEFTNPYRTPGDGESAPRRRIGAPPPITPAMLERGRLLFNDQTKGGCARCHGAQGRGDGPAATEMVDDYGAPVRPNDLTNPWRNKSGTSITEIYRTLSTGLSGTPMADFTDGVPDERDRWAMAMYAGSLLEERTVSGDPLVARHVDGPLSDDPDAPVWQNCQPFGLPLMGQYMRAPRWQAPSVDYVRVCAVYDGQEIALRVEWNDALRDDQSGPRPTPADAAPANAASETPAPSVGTAYFTIAQANARAKERFIPDRLYVQMPVGRRTAGDVQRPLMLMGDPRHPIDIWTWTAQGGGAIGEAYSQDGERGYQVRRPTATAPHGQSRWRAGRWRVVLRRSLTTSDPRHGTQFGPGDLVPFNVRVWDGSAGEEGLQSAMSSWRHLYLEAPTPLSAYVRGLLAALAGYVLVWLAWRRMRRNPLAATRPALQR